MDDIKSSNPFAYKGVLIVSAVVVLSQLILLFVSDYGVFIDEFYYIACSKHPDLGYVDHPPLSILLLALWSKLFGTSLFSLRTVPIVASGVLVFLTGLLAQRFGARAKGQVISAVLVTTISTLNVIFSFYSMNAIESCLWSLGILLTIDLVRTQRTRYLIPIAIVAGLAFLNKHTSILLFVSLGLSLLLTPQRKLLSHRDFIFAVVVMVVIISPNVVWMWQHDWVSLAFYANTARKNIDTPPLTALKQQLLGLNPGLFPFVLIGLIYLLKSRTMRPYRYLAWTFVILFITMIFSNQSRPDRIIGVYPMGVAAGVTAACAYIDGKRFQWVMVPLVIIPFVIFIIFLPVLKPIFSPSFTAAYSDALGVVPKIEKSGYTTALPQWLSDRLGWQTLAKAVSEIYLSLPPESRQYSVAVSPDYGCAGAIDYYADQLPLPPAFSPYVSYYYWGPPPESTRTVIAVGFKREQLSTFFADIKEVATVKCQLCRGFRKRITIHLARNPRGTYRHMWKLIQTL